MAYKSFSKEIFDKIELSLAQARTQGKKVVAAFDADGTLWDTDIGENFFRWQIAHSGLSLPKDPWRYYRNSKESGDPRPAYLWLAQINAGRSLAQVQTWASEAVESLGKLPIFQDQKRIIDLFHASGVEVYVVTASVKWSVEPAAQAFNIPPERVLGVATKIVNGLVTLEQEGEITYKQGKIAALLTATGGTRPFFASGNSMGDISLLENATGCALAVRSAPKEHELWETENDLFLSASKNNWLSHQF